MLSDKYEYWNRKWWYDFAHLYKTSDKQKMSNFIESAFTKVAHITKKWDNDINSEWIVRIYLAGKMIMASTLYLNSYSFSQKRNLRVVTSFLQYYGIAYSMRALLLMHPFESWQDGKILQTTHSKTINVVSDLLSKICGTKFTDETKKKILKLKAHRELISYRAPSTGDAEAPPMDEGELHDLCRVFVEMAQLYSEILEISCTKNAPRGKSFNLLDSYIASACHTTIEGFPFVDEEDIGRLYYLKKKHSIPSNVRQTIAEGHVEDFFGSWLTPKTRPNRYDFDPDRNIRLIFDLP